VQPPTPAATTNEFQVQEEKEMLVETGPAMDPDHITPSVTPSVTSVQVKDIHRSREELEETTAGSDYTGTSYVTSQLSDSEEEESGPAIKLGNSYTQVRSAREASMTVEVTDISCNENALVTEKKKGYRVGSMDKNLNNEILNCFKGVRIEKNGNLVNQYLSSSFDPSTNICITCSTEHSVVGGGGWIRVFCSF
jgi:ATP-dependent 26S proteasome regulatory subunit